MVDGRLRSIEVFGTLIVVIKLSSTKAQYLLVRILDGPKHPAAESVVTTFVALHCKAHRDQILKLVALGG